MSEQLPTTLSDEEKELIRLSQGNRSFEKDELTIPFLKVLQPLTPQAQEGNPDYVPGSKPGMFYNTSSTKLNDGKAGIICAVISHHKSYTQWLPERGGLVKDWMDDEGWQALCEPDQRHVFNPVTKEGHNIVKGRNFYLFNINLEDETYDPSVFAFTSTNLRTANRWSNFLNNDTFRAEGRIYVYPHYYRLYRFSTEFRSNAKGSWFTTKVEKLFIGGKQQNLQETSKLIWDAAIEFQKSLNEGTIRSSTPEDYGEDPRGGDEDTY
jgi:hypothetical protein